MTDTPDHDPDRDRQPSTSDPAAGAPRPARTGSVSKLGFDDPTLRPLPPDQLEYHAAHTEAHPEWHEHSDVPIRPLAWALGSIAALCLFSGVLLYFVFWGFEGQQRGMEMKARRTAVPNARPAVPEPRLEGILGFSDEPRTQDVGALRERWTRELSEYRRADQGAAQVPIDRAMELAVERGMFKTAPAPAPAPQGGAK